MIAVRVDAGCFHKDDRLQWPREITAFCSSLILIAENACEGRSPTIQLAHLSVKEYLEQCDVSMFTTSERMIAITHVCLTYLGSMKEDDNSRLRLQYPFARYAAEIWVDCARHAERSPSSLAAILAFLQNATAFRLWAGLFSLDRPWENEPGKTIAAPLYYACYSGLKETVYRLVSNGADINARGGFFGNALQAASYRGHREIVQLLLERGADVNAHGGFHCTALQAAPLGQDREIVQLLLDKGANINTQGGGLSNALHAASYIGHYEIVQLLLDKGADVNIQGGHYGNALQAASRLGHYEIVQLLLNNGADANVQGGSRGNALHAAACMGYYEIVQLLLDKGADVNAEDGSSCNALHAALLDHGQSGQPRVLEVLLLNGANVNGKDVFGRTPIFYAISYTSSLSSVQILLQYGALVGMQDHYGATPLLVAVRNGSTEVLELLLTKGADIHAIDINTADALGRSVSWWAAKTENTEIIDLLAHNGLIVTELAARDKQIILSTIEKRNDLRYCDVCLRGIPEQVSYHHCSLCRRNNFDICLDCYEGGLRCHEKSHTLTMLT